MTYPWLPRGGLTLSEYGTVFGAGLGRYLVNSVIVTAVCVVLTLSFCLAAAFRIVRRTGHPERTGFSAPGPAACRNSGARYPCAAQFDSARSPCSPSAAIRSQNLYCY